MIDLEMAVRVLFVLVVVIGVGIVLLVVGSLIGRLLKHMAHTQTRAIDEHAEHIGNESRRVE